jgi:hypothetical protein
MDLNGSDPFFFPLQALQISFFVDKESAVCDVCNQEFISLS